jgi:predicted RNA-binding protein with TRAM domain
MVIGKEYEVDIVDVSPNGEGVARIKGFPIFIKNAKLDERVKIRVISLGNGAADAEIVP